MLRPLTLVAVLLAFPGCARNLPSVLAALAQDQALACGHNELGTPWGNDRLAICRGNASGMEIEMKPDGTMSIKRSVDHVKLAELLASFQADLAQLKAAMEALRPTPARKY